MLYPTKAKLGYIFSLERQLRLRMRLCFYLAIFFIYLLIIYPACPARDEKSDDPPARVVAFSFAHSRPQGGRVQAARALLYKMTCRNCFSLSRPKKFV